MMNMTNKKIVLIVLFIIIIALCFFSIVKYNKSIDYSSDLNINSDEPLIDFNKSYSENKKSNEKNFSEDKLVAADDDQDFMPLSELEFILEEESLVPFEGHEFAQIFLGFWEAIENEKMLEKMSNDDIDLFILRSGLTIHSSAEAQQHASELYQTLGSEDDFKRWFLEQALVKSNAGVKIIHNEARRVFDQNHESLFPQMFDIMRNTSSKVDDQILEVAIKKLSSDALDEHLGLSALNYIGKMSGGEGEQSIHFQSALTSLKGVVKIADSKILKTVALQNIYSLTPPKESAKLAANFITDYQSKEIILETIHSISIGEVVLDEELKSVLYHAIQAENFTEKELYPYENIVTNL